MAPETSFEVPLTLAPAYSFGGFRLDTRTWSLTLDGRRAGLGARAVRLLHALMSRPEEYVSKAELLETAWPGLFVEEGNLSVQMTAIRRVLASAPGQPIRIETLTRQGYRLLAAQHPPSDLGRNNLPAALDSMFGREADIDALTQLLTTQRLVSIVGTGGIGKTRLAQMVARHQLGAHRDGVWWVDLATLTSADGIVPAIASAANLVLDDGVPIRMLARELVRRDTLLILDNCEHLIADVALIVEDALGCALQLRILTTSQEALRVASEHIYRLDALAVPPAGTSLSDGRGYAALQLLEQRARAADGRFALTEETVGSAIDLCRHLDGIALAIEMAAARLPMLGVDEVHRRLDERFRLLRHSGRTAPPRQQTLLAALEWSHSLLTQTEQAVLRRLSVFVGSPRVDVAQQVVAAGDVDEWSAIDALGTLADKSLLQVERVEPPRYRLPETVRMYALGQLRKHDEVLDTFWRHGQAMARLANEAEQQYWISPDSRWATRYAPDVRDFEAAFWGACERQDAGVAATADDVLHKVGSRGLTQHDRAEALHALLPLASPRARALIWNSMSICWPRLACGVPRVLAAREAVSAWQQIDDRQQLYLALGRWAFQSAQAGDLESASNALVEARRIEEATWPPRLRLWFTGYVANVVEQRGDAEAYRDHARQELALAELAGVERAAVRARSHLAHAAGIAGDFEEAVVLGLEVIAELRMVSGSSSVHSMLGNLAGNWLMLGNFESATAALLEAWEERWRIQGYLLDHIALLATRLGRSTEAAAMLGCADAWYTLSQMSRSPTEARSAQLARRAIEASLEPGDGARLLIAGGQLTDESIDAIVRSVLSKSTSL